jgi:hypothetical protein
MGRKYARNFLCFECATVYAGGKRQRRCPKCGKSINRLKYQRIVDASYEAVQYGHLYRDYFERLEGRDGARTWACLAVDEIWVFAGVAALSGIIGNASYEVVKAVIRKIVAANKSNRTNAGGGKPFALENDAEVERFLAHLSDYGWGMPNPDKQALDRLCRQIMGEGVDGSGGLEDEKPRSRHDGEQETFAAEDIGKQILAFTESVPKRERPNENDFGGMWQIIVQGGGSPVAADFAREPQQATTKKRKDGGQRKVGMTHALKAGDVLVSRWATDPKHVEFFQVLKTTNQTVIVRRIKTLKVAADDGLATCDCIAQRGAFHTRSRPIRKLVRPASHEDGGYCLHFQSGIAYMWDGNPVRATTD